MVIRFQGGDNAGHTVVIGEDTFKLHLIPSGIFNPNTINIIGTGCVVNPDTLLAEIKSLQEAGIDVSNLYISDRAQVNLPYHQSLDGLQESARSDQPFGTTKRGIGPAYADKGARRGLRIGDLLRPDWLRQRLEPALENANREIVHFGGQPFNLSDLYEQCLTWGETLSERIVDSVPLVRDTYRAGKSILLEGQLGVMRDLDWGIYPYVTSSNPTAAFAPSGAGLPHHALNEALGVVKAYSSSVGEGPFVTELFDEAGEYLRREGQEFGATTGRPRRCGWFDGVAIGYASWLNGFTSIAVTKLDILDGLKEIKLCTHYRMLNGKLIDYVPDTPDLELVEPVYETWPGWESPTTHIRVWDDLPENAKRYLQRIEALAQAKIVLVGVGPERDAIIKVD
jgi:adenylosuccinate synthase